MTDDQLQTLIAALQQTPPQMDGGPKMAAGAAAVVGQMPPCHLGKNKIKRFKKWKDWISDAENKMAFLEMDTDKQKINFIRSCGGPELIEFWEKEAHIRFKDVLADLNRGTPAQPAHSYAEIMIETKKTMLKLVSRDRAIIDLLRIEQGGRSFMDFLAEVEDQEYLCRTDEEPITSEDLKRMSLVAGMKDRTLAEKAIAEEYTLHQLIQAGVNRESSRANVEAMQARPTATVSCLEDQFSVTEADLDSRIRHLEAELQEVWRIRKHGKYSGRFKAEGQATNMKVCKKCTYTHQEGRCPADGRRCNTCGIEGHFTRSSLCKRKQNRPHFKNTWRVEQADDTSTPSEDSDQEYEAIARIRTVGDNRSWPGVDKAAQGTYDIHYVQRHTSEPGSKRVKITMGGVPVQLYCDTGSRLTIIPPELYQDRMGKVVPAKCHLRAWGSSTRLDTKGMFQTTLVTPRGARQTSWVYVVGGTRPEPLLGEVDAEALGIIRFKPNGRAATVDELDNTVSHMDTGTEEQNSHCVSIPEKLRRAGLTVCSDKPINHPVSATAKHEAEKIVEEFIGPVFTDRTGQMKTQSIVLQYEPGFRPIQPPRHPVPYHYQDRVATHLRKLKAEDIIEDVDPAEPVDCVLNIVVSEKKTEGAIRMNIDARPLNVGAKHTKYHVTTPQEVRHQLQGATVFSEMDMGNGFHQVPLAPESQCVFQSHIGIHRMKRLFFGPKNSSGIFHHEVRKAFSGVPGCITIHDNILVYGRDASDHNKNLRATLQRAQDMGITFKLSKSTFCVPEVKWFGRIFSGAGVSADPDKIQTIVAAGRPESLEEVKSLLQAAAYNAKFAFDHQENETYEEVTAPLRELLAKFATFSWDDRRERSFHKLLRMMNDRSILTPFKVERKTHLVTDASPQGISASLYQEDEQGRWLPVDHISRALSQHEQAWKSQIEWESLAKMWGMTAFRPYLIGTKFTSWGDHQPLLPFYNDLTKPATARINKHRARITDLTFTDKYLSGKVMPADFNSRHPQSISHLNRQEREEMAVDDGEDIHIMRVIMNDLPPALTTDMIQQAALTDPVYHKLIQAVQQGKKTEDPDLRPYTSIWGELGVLQGLVCRGERIVIPDGYLPDNEGSIREWVVELGHSGHLGINATKRLLRLRLWFPGMDKMVERKVASCLPCQAATDCHLRDPLKPNPAPAEPWDRVFCDHWGPTPTDGKHILVIIDGLTRYPEVLTVNGTGAEDNIHAFSEVFARHGLPRYLHSDNGPPFNGRDSHLLQKYFQSLGVQHLPNHSAQDPESTGLVEAFMKHLQKIFHTSAAEHLDPYLQIHDHLLHFRATPHPSTGKSPAELLFGRKFRTKLPDLRPNPAKNRPDILAARAADTEAKARMKLYKDNKATVQPTAIRQGDRVLLKQKTTKLNSVYDPEPYTVTRTWGSQIEAERDGMRKLRDAQRWKKVALRPRQQFQLAPSTRSGYQDTADIGAPHREVRANQQPAPERGQSPPPAVPMADPDARAPPVGVTPLHAAAAQPILPAERHDIISALKRHPQIILADTVANRPRRQRKPPAVIYTPSPW